MTAIRKFVFWEYPRGSWQYDVIVLLILAFVFLIPRSVFQDQPKGSDLVRLPSVNGAAVFWVSRALLDPVPIADRAKTVEQKLRERFGRSQPVTSVEPISNENQLDGYLAFAKP